MRATLGLLIALAFSADAFAYCSEATAPSCAGRYGPFDDEWDFDRCKREMETYRSEIEGYRSCRALEAQDAIDEANRDSENAASEYSNAVNDFNRRAQQ